jgi:hypothetical protein
MAIEKQRVHATRDSPSSWPGHRDKQRRSCGGFTYFRHYWNMPSNVPTSPRAEKTCIEKYERHMKRMELFLLYVFEVQKIVPKLALGVPKEHLKKMAGDIESVILLTRQIYNRPDLGSSPPDPLPVDPNCPDYLISDHLQGRLGRNAPLFDLVNAPFTHPIGTELAMICIDHAWDGYDTLIKELIGELKRRFPNHPKVQALRRARAANQSLSTEESLGILGIATSWEKICAYIALHSDEFHIKPEQAEKTFDLAKRLRTIRTHLLGEPTSEFIELISNQSFADYSLRMVDGELEVTLVLSRNVIEVIYLRAKAIYEIARAVYGI